MVIPSFSRVLASLSCVLVLAACGSPAAPGDDPAPSPGDVEGGTQAPAANVTDGCAEGGVGDVDHFPDKVTFDEATGVSVTYSNTYKLVEVVLPGSPDAEPVRYVLHQCGTPEPVLDTALGDAQVVQVPVQRVVSLTTTNLPHFDVLDAVDRLVGVGTAGFVSTVSVRDRIDAGEVGEFGDSQGRPDLEKVFAAAPDLLLMDGFGDSLLDDVDRLVEGGVPAAIKADFDERMLLGRAEWLKFTALFLNAEAAATAAYDEIAERYHEIASRARAATERPSVFVNTPYEGTWFTAGGASFLAGAIADAGGDYVFADDDATGGVPVDFETVLDAAGDADVWIQAGSMHGTLDDLLAQDERLGLFNAFAEGEVWAYDRWVTEGGGNAVFETAYTRVDLFLGDLARIFHPDLLDDHDFVFFGQVPAGRR